MTMNQYSAARDAMPEHTDQRGAPWIPAAADDKKSARLKLIGGRLQCSGRPERVEHWAQPDRRVVFEHASSGGSRWAR